MKQSRRDFLKLGVGAVIVGTVAANEAASKMTATNANAEPVQHQDWSVKFNSVTVHVTKDTYDAFFNDRQRSHSPEDFLGYLLSGTTVPRCEKVYSMNHDNNDITAITFKGVVFTSNTRQHPLNFFTGYEHARFCLSSPNSKSAMYIKFSEQVTQRYV